MTPEVQVAIEEIQLAFPNSRLEVNPEADGGAYVIMHDLNLGASYEPETSWLGSQITFQYPRADVYPHFVDGQIRRKDGKPLGEGFSGSTQWQGRAAVQISRRSNRLNPTLDTAASKFAKVLEWVRSK